MSEPDHISEDLFASHKCGATTAAGEPCSRWAVLGHRHCYVHDPAFSEELKAARRRGGLNRREKPLPVIPSDARTVRIPSSRKWPRKVKQEHGGELYTGGVRGNRGGSGRPSNRLRRELTRLLDEHGVGLLAQVLANDVRIRLRFTCEHCGKEPTGRGHDAKYWEVVAQVPTIAERLFAFRLAAKYSIGSVKGVTEDEIRERASDTLAIVYEELGEKAYKKLIPRMRRIWRDDSAQPINSGEKTGDG